MDLRQHYRAYILMLNERSLDDMHRFAHDELVYNGRRMTRAEYTASVRSTFDAVPDFRWSLEDLVIEGDRVAALLTDTGTPIAKFLGLKPTGRSLHFAEMSHYAFPGGEIRQGGLPVRHRRHSRSAIGTTVGLEA